MTDSEGLSDADFGVSSNVARYVELGNIVLAAAGAKACQSGYGTTDPEWVGRYALEYGDIRPDGTLN